MTAAIYLFALGGTALVRPEPARQFLGSHATARAMPFTELGPHSLESAAFIIAAPRAPSTLVFLLVGWVLVASLIALTIDSGRLLSYARRGLKNSTIRCVALKAVNSRTLKTLSSGVSNRWLV